MLALSRHDEHVGHVIGGNRSQCSRLAFGGVIGESYPQAYEHLRAARDAKSEMAAKWSDLLDGGLVEVSVVTNPDGTGRISAIADWPDGSREVLTELFRRCLDELWACLDSLITESVAMFSAHKRLRNPERPRYFPMADSEEALDALLAESCLDGVLTKQSEMVIDCQPFWGVHNDARIQRFRTGLRLLLEWTACLDDGSMVGAWVTPVKPQLHVTPPIVLQSLEPLSPGELTDDRDVARYKLAGYEFDANVFGQAGSYIDLGFARGHQPANDDDTFDQGLNLVIDMVTRFALSFAWLADQVPGSRGLVTLSEHASIWTEASASRRLWTGEELEALAASDFGVGILSDADQLTLLVTTEHGVFERSIPAATPLNPYALRGPAAERATQDAAATWGLPDFVMSPIVERKGSGVREISDGLIVTGDRGLVVQVKSRDTKPGSAVREASWLTKKIADSGRQVDGTARRLSSKTTTMLNGRGRTVELDGKAIEWTGVVIIDHPCPPPGYQLDEFATRIPTVVLLRRDWEFLFHQLRSSHAVIDYLVRVAGLTKRLGGEPERYYELAAADARAEPAPPDPAIGALGTHVSTPLLPAAPAGNDDDEAHGMVRIMCEDIATVRLDPDDEVSRLRVLAAIDELPVGYRSELGRLLLDGLEKARCVEQETTSWQFRTFRSDKPGAQLGFGICSVLNEVTHAAFRSWLLLRHYERGVSGGDLDTLTSVGVLLTPRRDGYREWDTTMMAVTGDPELTEEELRDSRKLWNTPHQAETYPS